MLWATHILSKMELRRTFFSLTYNIYRGNQFHRNLGILTKKSFSLLNTDQIPAVFWITNPNNSYVNNSGTTFNTSLIRKLPGHKDLASSSTSPPTRQDHQRQAAFVQEGHCLDPSPQILRIHVISALEFGKHTFLCSMDAGGNYMSYEVV